MRRSSHAEYVAAPANQLTPRPASVPWEVAGSTATLIAELADLIARGELEVPIAGVFALDVRDAFRQLELRHSRGKLVLRP
jgi:NADPH:quinone reductase-like Zn-dependent oxidoreductase